MKKKPSRLRLNKETLRRLTDDQLNGAVGGEEPQTRSPTDCGGTCSCGVSCKSVCSSEFAKCENETILTR